MGRLDLENQVIEGMMGQLRLVHNYNNMCQVALKMLHGLCQL